MALTGCDRRPERLQVPRHQPEQARSFSPGHLNLTGPEGFYVGTWASTVDWQLAGINNNPYVEVDIYGGKHTDLWGVDWNIEPYYYSYPDANYRRRRHRPTISS